MDTCYPTWEVGSLRVRSDAQVAAFLTSIHASSSLVGVTLPSHFSSISPFFLDDAKSLWAQGRDHLPPVGSGTCRLKSWGGIKVAAMATQLRKRPLLMLIKLVYSRWPLKSRVHGYMPCLFHLWGSSWTMIPFISQLYYT